MSNKMTVFKKVHEVKNISLTGNAAFELIYLISNQAD